MRYRSDIGGILFIILLILIFSGTFLSGWAIRDNQAQTDTETEHSVSVSSPSVSHVLHGARHSCRSLLERLNQMQVPKANSDSAAVIFRRNGEFFFDVR